MLWGADGLIGYRWTDAGGVNRSRYHLYDVQGNLAQALDEAGNVVETAGVTVHGMPLVNGSAFGVSSAFAYGAKFGYYRDGESGFYLCGFRYYDPSGGRWITRDPIGFAGGANLYGYVGNDPVNAVDPDGLWAPVIAPVVAANPVLGSIVASAGAVYGVYLLTDTTLLWGIGLQSVAEQSFSSFSI